MKVLDNVRDVVADVVLVGEKKDSLFAISVGEAYVKKTSQTDSATTWHARLGHLGYQMLQQISSNKLLDGLPTHKNIHEDVICQGCQYGKSHRLPFKSSSNRRSGLFELVHTDLMGPTKTPSYSGYHYVMVLVGDPSRYTWVHFLKEKSEALLKFVEFNSTINKEFGQKIKCLRSDNGGEFMSDDFFQYCDNNGIQRQMTCPNTPQQNGVAERKLAHLTSTSLSWMHDKNLPRELWAETIQCACHVINRRPPWPGKKGWKCMDPTTKKFVTSRDVVFDEVSSWYSAPNTIIKNVDLDDDQDNLRLFPPTNAQEPCDDPSYQRREETPVPSSADSEQMIRRSTRKKNQSDYLNDYEVQLNHCTVTHAFFVGAQNEEEPTCYEEAKNYPEWGSSNARRS